MRGVRMRMLRGRRMIESLLFLFARFLFLWFSFLFSLGVSWDMACVQEDYGLMMA
jgi:hypothetical protein